MSQYISIEHAIADIQAGITRTLALVCNHLINQRAVDKSLLIADLTELVVKLSEQGVSQLGCAIPDQLSVALRQSSAVQP